MCSRIADVMQLSPDILERSWFLAGPTACGKSQAGVVLAQRISAEIVAMDSMSLYRGMDVGTAKPSAVLQAAVPHHLIDVVAPHADFSVAQYLAAASRAAQEILERGRTPLFVGGTGLYLRSLLRGVFTGPGADPEIRQLFESVAAGQSPEVLHERLRACDPASASRIHPHDTRRVIRALEVFVRTGRPLSELHREGPLSDDRRPRHVYWLAPPRDWLREQIDRRVEQMFARGLVDEVRRLLAAPEPLSRTARQALGYKEVIEHVEGRSSLAETVQLVQARTRQFAKRQHTWFRNLDECRPIEISGAETAEQLAQHILEFAKDSRR